MGPRPSHSRPIPRAGPGRSHQKMVDAISNLGSSMAQNQLSKSKHKSLDLTFSFFLKKEKKKEDGTKPIAMKQTRLLPLVSNRRKVLRTENFNLLPSLISCVGSDLFVALIL